MDNVSIRHTTGADLMYLPPIYEQARRFMRSRGNLTQWAGGYPAEADLIADIGAGNSYVCEHGGVICGTFAFIIGDDPTYRRIEGGAWRASRPYGTIHRLASTGIVRGLARHVFDFCATKVGYLRADTHDDNHVTQDALVGYGFVYCGTIYVRDGTPRRAYDYLVRG